MPGELTPLIKDDFGRGSGSWVCYNLLQERELDKWDVYSLISSKGALSLVYR